MSARSTTYTFVGVDKFSKVADQVAGKASHMGGKMGKSGLLVAGAAGAVATGTALAAKASIDLAKGAAQDQKSQTQLARTLKNTAGASKSQVASVEDYIAKAGLATGVTDDKMRPAFARLTRSTGDIAESQKLMQVAMDVSAGTGKDLETVAGALAKAHDGQSGALSRLGIKTKDASGKALDFDGILKNTARTFKGAAADGAQTMDGKMSRLKLRFDEAKESLGAKLLPIFDRLASWVLDKGIPMFQRWSEKIMPKVRDVLDRIRQSVEDNRPGLEKLGGILLEVGRFVAEKVVPAWLNFEGKVLPLVVKAIGKVGDILPPIVAAYLTGAATVVHAFHLLYTGVTTVLSGILTTAEKTMGWIPGIGDKITNAKKSFDRFKDGADKALTDTEANLRTAATEVRNFGSDVKALPNQKDISITANVRYKYYDPRTGKYSSGSGGMGGNIPAPKPPAGPSLGDAGSGKSAGLMSATHGVGHPGAKFGAWGTHWSWNRRNGRGQHDGADITGTGYGARVYAPRTGRYLGRLSGGWHGNAVQWANRGAVLTYAHLRNFGGSMPGGVIGYTGSTGSNATGPHLHIQARRGGTYVNPAAYLADGGIVRRRPGGTVVVAGEGRHDEAVVPLDGRRFGGGDTYEIHVHGGFDQAAAREMQRALLDLQRRTGRPLFPAAASA